MIVTFLPPCLLVLSRTLAMVCLLCFFNNKPDMLGMLHTTLIELDYYDGNSQLAIMDSNADITGMISDVRNVPCSHTMRHFSFNNVCLLASFCMLCFWCFKHLNWLLFNRTLFFNTFTAHSEKRIFQTLMHAILSSSSIYGSSWQLVIAVCFA